ncbi:hypothetical protein [Caulobacter sp. 17J80-11]|uniref:hypothetical protein n=1 Tax=Caulobacter sp. 17J80-11 TaxID=2763502 RepID=UPI001653CB53|nr:hypothetical protein [Caulobacter sp. 17J80-11]MBC6980418.1 hypothetical protein [Caulobacter sp. 17J80-11]
MRRAACPNRRRPLSPARPVPESLPMIAIATIAVFVVALAALNLYEFGRLD